MGLEVDVDGVERRTNRTRIRPVPHLAADLAPAQNAGVAQHPQVVRDRGARERRCRDDLADREALVAART